MENQTQTKPQQANLNLDKALSQDGDEPESTEDTLTSSRRQERKEYQDQLTATESFHAIIPQGEVRLTSSVIRIDGLMTLANQFFKWHSKNFPKARRKYIG